MQPKQRSGKFDWQEIETAFVESDEDLYTFSREKTKNPNHPTLSTLQAKYYERGWAKMRSARIKADLIESEGKTQAYQDEVTAICLTATEDLTNANRIIERHFRVADQTLAIVQILDMKAIAALELLNLEQLAVDDPKGFIGALKIIQDLKAGAIEIQRKTISLSGLSVNFSVEQPNETSDMQAKLEKLKHTDQSELLKAYFERLN